MAGKNVKLLRFALLSTVSVTFHTLPSHIISYLGGGSRTRPTHIIFIHSTKLIDLVDLMDFSSSL